MNRFYRIKCFCIPFCMFIIFFLNNSLVLAQTKQSSLSNGLEYFQNGKHEQALEEFEDAVKAEPANADAHYYIGLTYNKLDKNDKAVFFFKKAIELNPGLENVHLSLGTTYYKLKEYDSALQTLNYVINIEPLNASAHFFLGLIYQGKNQYQKSISFFQKAMDLEPEFNQLSLFNIGLSYFKMGRDDQARDALNDAIEINPQSDTAKDSRKFLSILADRKKKKKRWGIRASTGWEYDDNLSRIEKDIVTGEQDSAVVFEFEGEYKIIDTPKYALEVSYDFYQSRYKKITDLDFLTHSFSLSGSREMKKWDTGIDYTYSYNRLGDEKFLDIHSLMPNIGFSAIPALYTSINYIVQKKRFFTDSERDAINHSISFYQFLFFMENKAYLNLNYTLDAENTNSSEFDYIGHSFTLGSQIQLKFQSKIKLSYEYNLKDYLDITSSIGEERRDKKHTINFVLTKKLFKNLEFKVDYQNINSISNLESVDYNENVVFVGLALSL